MKTVILAVACSMSVWAQGSAVNQVTDPPPTAALNLFFYDGSNNLQYVCGARQFDSLTTYQSRSDSSLTSIVVLTNVGTVTTANAHGLYIGARVTISGATVDTDLNATYTIATVPSTTTYTIATASVANATYTESTLVIATNSPLTTLARWAIQVLTYNGSNYLTASYWAGASTAYNLACTNRTAY